MASATISGDIIARPSASGNDVASLEQDLELVAASKRTDIVMDNGDEDRSESTALAEPCSIAGLSAAIVASQLGSMVWQRMRTDFPWIKTEAIAKIADQCGALIQSSIIEQQPIVDAAKSRVSFMSLSPELRELVYDFALVSDETDVNCSDPRNIAPDDEYIHNIYGKPVICVQRCEVSVEDYPHTNHYGWMSEWALQPALTRVSRQIRAEALPFYYKKNEFAAFSTFEDEDDLTGLYCFLSSIGKHNASLIRRLTILFPYNNDQDVAGDDVRSALGGERSGISRAAIRIFEGGHFGNGGPNKYWELR